MCVCVFVCVCVLCVCVCVCVCGGYSKQLYLLLGLTGTGYVGRDLPAPFSTMSLDCL